MAIDLIKRQRIIERSRKLGHCICDPKKACPCELLKEKNVCLCAGEKPDTQNSANIRLTQFVHTAGCGSKIPPAALARILSRLPSVDDPRVLSGIKDGDDAGIFKMSNDLALAQTVDVFTPCVDDPYVFGQIAASNSVSDIYAMGGTPLTALSVLSFPSDTLPEEYMFQMMKGGMDKLKEAGVSIIGGHSIKSEEILFGFAVTGIIDPQKISSNNKAQPGDLLVLTKPLGTGIISFAAQINRASPQAMEEISKSMTQLNKQAADIMSETGVNSCTDITGFGLFGHLINLARHSKVTVNIEANKLPIFEEALLLVRQGVVPGAIERNREYLSNDIEIQENVDPAVVELGFDAQTSGGLLIALPNSRAATLVECLHKQGIPAVIIGEVIEHSEGRIKVIGGETGKIPVIMVQPSTTEPAACCAHVSLEHASLTKDPKAQFLEFMASASRSGAIDNRQKELITFALVVLARCGQCIKIHFEKARAMGITPEELEEAALLAVAMGGAPVMVFYDEVKKNIKK